MKSLLFLFALNILCWAVQGKDDLGTALMVKSYCKEAPTEVWLNGEPVSCAPGQPYFRTISTYPLQKGSNYLEIRSRVKNVSLKPADFECGLIKGDVYVVLPKLALGSETHNLEVKFECDAPVNPALEITNKEMQLDGAQIAQCQSASIALINALLGSPGAKSLSKEIRGISAFPINNPQFQIVRKPQEASQLRALVGKRLILIYGVDDQNPEETRLVQAQVGQVEVGTNFLVWWPHMNGLHLLGGKWIRYDS